MRRAQHFALRVTLNYTPTASQITVAGRIQTSEVSPVSHLHAQEVVGDLPELGEHEPS